MLERVQAEARRWNDTQHQWKKRGPAMRTTHLLQPPCSRGKSLDTKVSTPREQTGGGIRGEDRTRWVSQGSLEIRSNVTAIQKPTRERSEGESQKLTLAAICREYRSPQIGNRGVRGGFHPRTRNGSREWESQ